LKEIKEMADLNPKGHVKIDMFDKNGMLVDRYENHNVVVDSATDIIADSLAKPSVYTEVEMTFTEDTQEISDSKGRYLLKNKLPYAKSKIEEVTVAMGDITTSISSGAGLSELTLPDVYMPVDKLKKVVLTDGSSTSELKIGLEVFVKDADNGVVGFADDITTTSYTDVIVTLYSTEIRSTDILSGTEEVVVGVTNYKVSNAVDSDGDHVVDESNKYGIDYNNGDVWFNNANTGVEVTYKYRVEHGINFMGIGDMPDGHTAGYPVVLNDEDKDLEALRNEHSGARQPLDFPAQITQGSLDTVTRQGDGSKVQFEIEANKTPLINLEEVTVFDNGTPINYEPVETFSGNGNEVKIVSLGDGNTTPGTIEFDPAPVASDTKNIRIDFKWDSGATVNFVAEFAPDTPQPSMEDSQEAFTGQDGQTDFTVEHAVADNLYVEVNGTQVGASVDGSNSKLVVLDSSVSAGDNVVIEYAWLKEEYSIYEVGLFNGADNAADMFSISGVGPITKDNNTGMRITWSITF
jgi:hypothetical protein